MKKGQVRNRRKRKLSLCEGAPGYGGKGEDGKAKALDCTVNMTAIPKDTFSKVQSHSAGK